MLYLPCKYAIVFYLVSIYCSHPLCHFYEDLTQLKPMQNTVNRLFHLLLTKECFLHFLINNLLKFPQLVNEEQDYKPKAVCHTPKSKNLSTTLTCKRQLWYLQPVSPHNTLNIIGADGWMMDRQMDNERMNNGWVETKELQISLGK